MPATLTHMLVVVAEEAISVFVARHLGLGVGKRKSVKNLLIIKR